MEFGEDLETYHKQGYGHELNYHQACPLVEDLVTRIRYTYHVTEIIGKDILILFTLYDAELSKLITEQRTSKEACSTLLKAKVYYVS